MANQLSLTTTTLSPALPARPSTANSLEPSNRPQPKLVFSPRPKTSPEAEQARLAQLHAPSPPSTSLPKLPLPNFSPSLRPTNINTTIALPTQSPKLTLSPHLIGLFDEELVTTPAELSQNYRFPATASSAPPGVLLNSDHPQDRYSDPHRSSVGSFRSSYSFMSSAATNHTLRGPSPSAGWYPTPPSHLPSGHAHTPSESHSTSPLISTNNRARALFFHHSSPSEPHPAPIPAHTLAKGSTPISPAGPTFKGPSLMQRHASLQSNTSQRYRTHSGVLEIRLPRLEPPPPLPPSSLQPRPLPNRPASSPHSLTSPRRSSLPSKAEETRRRVYETHEGNLMFCCAGRIVSARPTHALQLGWLAFGRHSISLSLPWQTLGSFVLIIGLGTIFLAATAPSLIYPQSSSGQQSSGGTALVVIFSYSWAVCLGSMAKTMASDPGVLPRELDPSPEMEWRAGGTEKESGGQLEVGTWELQPRWVKVELGRRITTTVEMGGRGPEWVQCKWCPSCLTYRPPRSSHCRVCDCCIDGIDHHCTYLNTCVGARNYLSFITFLTTCVFNLLLIIGTSLWKILHFGPNNISANGLNFAVLLFSGGLLIPIASLFSYHAFLTYSGLTTVEYIKRQTAKRVLRENKKLLGNEGQERIGWQDSEFKRNKLKPMDALELVLLRLCAPGGARYIDWNAWVEEEKITQET